jgi:hypothetical protein
MNMFADLSNGTATNTGWQHDVRTYKEGSLRHITMFDNHALHTGHCEEGRCGTRGLHLEIDEHNMTARVVQEYYHPANIDVGAMGGFQQLENGNVLVSFGWYPSFVEYSSNGSVVMDVQRGAVGGEKLVDMFAYRTEKYDWVGKPSWPPAIAVDSPHGTTSDSIVYVSWNGATEVTRWYVVSFAHPNTLTIHMSPLGPKRDVWD